MPLDKYQQKLLYGWEDVYKQGQLTFWIMLALKDGPKHMADINDFIQLTTKGSMKADDRSIYRALRRYQNVELLTFTTSPAKGGPDRKVYELTATGQAVLSAFIRRNITDVYYDEPTQSLIKKGL